MNTYFVVYYNQLPTSLTDFVRNHKELNLIKEGVRSMGITAFPRLTIRIVSGSAGVDKDLCRDLSTLLQKMQDEKSIINYSVQG